METTHLKIEKLRDKDNWHQWRFIIRTLLEENQDTLDVCEGKLVRPGADDQDAENKLKKFEKADKAARKLIVTTVERKPLDLLLNCTTAKEMWTKLSSVYDLKSDENLSLVQKQFFELKWDCSENVAHNLSKLEQLAMKMKSLGGEIPNSMILSRALSVLPQKFNHFHSAWDSENDTKKTFENLTTRLMNEEIRLQKQENSEETTVALLSRSESRNTSSKNKSRQKAQSTKEKGVVCFSCGKRGHVKKDCTGCYSCGSKGHIRKNCPKQSEKTGTRDEANSTEQDGGTTKQAFFGSSGAAVNDFWVIDSGASDHMTRRCDWFSSFEEFEKPLTVRVGNGEEIPVYGRGNIEIETLVNGQWISGMIGNVLYVPCLKRNLFSVKVAAKKGVDFSLTDHGSRFILIP